MKTLAVIFILLFSTLCYAQEDENDIRGMVSKAMKDEKVTSFKLNSSDALKVANLYLQIQNIEKEIAITIERELWRRGIPEKEFGEYNFNYQTGMFRRNNQ